MGPNTKREERVGLKKVSQWGGREEVLKKFGRGALKGGEAQDLLSVEVVKTLEKLFEVGLDVVLLQPHLSPNSASQNRGGIARRKADFVPDIAHCSSGQSRSTHASREINSRYRGMYGQRPGMLRLHEFLMFVESRGTTKSGWEGLRG